MFCGTFWLKKKNTKYPNSLINIYRTRRKNNMQTFKKTTAIAIALFLIISMGASMILLPAANAHTPSWNIPTFAYINVAPNPVGVGQQASVIMWLDKTFDPSIALSNDYRFHNYNLTITKPDGSTETKIFDTVIDTTSSQFYAYTPTTTGKYTFTFTFPGQAFNQYSHPTTSALVNDTYLPSSASTTVTVQQDAITGVVFSYPLPAEYWTRPIYGENTDWWTISSNWLGTGAAGYGVWTNAWAMRNPGDAVGPLTAHIMWTKPLQSGGVAGGNNFAIQGDTNFEGSAYNQRYTNPIIVNGKLYYTEPRSFTGVEGIFSAVKTYGPTDCVDLRTGQMLWSRNDVPALSFALFWDVQDPNQHGVYPAILSTANFAQCFDADTGDPIFNVTNVPAGGGLFGGGSPAGAAVSGPVMGPWGEQIRYVMANAGNATKPNWWLAQWNSTNLWSGSGFVDSGGAALSPTISGTVDGGTANRYDYNVSISWANTIPTIPSPFGPFVPASAGFSVVAANYGDIMLCENGTMPGLATSQFGTTSSAPYTYFAVNLNASRGTVGSVMWWNTVPATTQNITVVDGPVDFKSRVFTEAYKETMQWVGYNLDTGAKIWGPTPSQTAFDYYGNPALPYINGVTDNGKLYSVQFGGILYTYDLKTGDLLWTYGNGGAGNSTNAGVSNAYGVYPTFINAIGNGVIYTVTSEHTITTPLFKGSLSRAINATDGTEIWTLNSYVGEFFAMSYAISDGYATWFNGLDNQIYVVGRGPSTTTVEAPMTDIPQGTGLVIRGTVMDVSSGTTQNEQAARFANGVPLSSDATMKDWMGYVYQQKPLPTNFKGVEVTIDVIDSNGNYRNIGTATTDATGTYSYQWTPDITGKYTVIATFHGTNGYWPSYTETNFAVDPAHPTTAPTATPPQSAADLYFVPAIAGLFVAIIVVIALLAILLLRKRP
jgi:hypothetical protein